MTSLDDIRERLTEIRPLGSPRDIVALGIVHAVHQDAGIVTIRVAAPGGMPSQTLNAMVADMRRAVGALDGVRQVHVHLEAASPPAGAAQANPPNPMAALPGVRDIIAVSSAKGGVGKSTVAANLALALHRLGQRVGLLDSDVYGPSVPILFGVSERPQILENKHLVPLEKFGIRLMSIGFFLDDDSPVIWRGPMVMGMVRQFLKDVEWGELDTLIVDMPPGTGDAQLTLVQQVPLAGGVIVTTPQAVATLDVERGIAMFQQVKTPILGIVENLSDYVCPTCGAHDDIFGSGGAQRVATRLGVSLLGQIPLVPAIRAGGDAGKPIVVDQPEHPISRLFLDIAEKIAAAVDVERTAFAAPTIID